MKRPFLVLICFFLAGELLCIKSLKIAIILSAGILMLALIFMLIQIVCKNVFFKKMSFFLCICAFSFFTGAVCCFSANAHSHIYDTLLSMQHSKENTLDDVIVEGNVTKVEEKSKLWIYIKNASINKKAAGEGAIVQVPISTQFQPKASACRKVKLLFLGNYHCFHRLQIQANLIHEAIITAWGMIFA